MKGTFIFWTSDPSSEGFDGPGWYYAVSDGVFGHPALRLGGPFGTADEASEAERHGRGHDGLTADEMSERQAGC